MARSKWMIFCQRAALEVSRSDLLGQLVTSADGGSGSGSSGSIAGGVLQGSSSDVTEQLTSLTTQLTSLTSIQQSQISALQDNTQAVTQNTGSKGSSGSSVGSTVESVRQFLRRGAEQLVALAWRTAEFVRRRRSGARGATSVYVAGADAITGRTDGERAWAGGAR